MTKIIKNVAGVRSRDRGGGESPIVSSLRYGMEPREKQVGSFVWNLDDNSLRCSATAHSLVGMESISTLDEAMSLLHPDDRDRFLRQTEKMISERQLPPMALRVLLPDGTQKTLVAAGEFSCDVEGKPVRCCGVVYDITETKRVDEAVRYASELRNMVTSMSTRFINLHSGEIDTGIQDALETLGRFAEVDRSYVFLMSDNGKNMSNTHEWCAEGIAPQMKGLQNVPVSTLPWLSKKLGNFEIVHIPDVSKLPKAAQREKREFERQAIRSLIVVPMVLRHTLTGFVGFDSVRERKTWTDDMISVLRLVGEMIANAMDRKNAEVRLKQSEEKYRALVQDAYSIILRIDTEGTITFCNEFAVRFFGFEAKELIGENVVGTIVPKGEPTIGAAKWRTWGTGQKPWCHMNHVSENQRKNGERVWIAWANRPVMSDDGRTIEMLCVGNDITDQKRAEEALAKSEARYRALFDSSGDAIFLLKDGRCFDCNRQAERMSGYSRDAIIGSFPSSFSPLLQEDGRRSAEKAEEMMSRALKGTPQIFEWLHQRQDGTLVDAEVTLTAVNLGDETIVQAIVRDITDRKLAENELEISRRRLQSLANHLISVREDEKSHIARELHDELGQVLTALKMDLKWLGGKLGKNGRALSSKTDQMAELVTHTIQTVKRIQGELRPTLLDNLGLIAAMEWQTKEFQERTNLDVSFSHPAEINADEDTAIALFRIFQEAQTNVAKHARATKVEIDLSETDNQLLMTVADNGQGLRPEDYNKPDSFGLLGIKERVLSLRGQFSIDSKRGVGTRLIVMIPKKRSAPQSRLRDYQ